MRTRKELEAINADGKTCFGYLNFDCFPCPPFVMFTNNEDCPVCAYFRENKTFEPQSMKLWCNLVKEATSVLDVGAHAGVYSLVAAALRSDITIHAFEPNPDAFARLLVNLNANGVENVRPQRCAIAHQNKFFQFGWSSKWMGHISSGAKFLVGQAIEPHEVTLFVKVMRLDDAVQVDTLGPRPLIKIDTEGAEKLVFSGMDQILELKPDIILETFDPEICLIITEMTKPLGYNYYLIDDEKMRIEQQPALSPGAILQVNRNQLLTTRTADNVTTLAR